MRAFTNIIAALAAIATVSAKNIVVTVGGNTTDNATSVFEPAEVFANLNDIVFFNFTKGNHTATQSSFASPCILIDDTDPTQHGFNSGFRNAGNGSSITIQSVPITPDLVNKTLWFFDFNTCAQGGVGGININDSSTQTLDGIVRNAIRLNGTNSTSESSSSTASQRSTSTSPPSPSTSSGSGNSASGDATRQHVTLGLMSIVPLVLAAITL